MPNIETKHEIKNNIILFYFFKSFPLEVAIEFQVFSTIHTRI